MPLDNKALDCDAFGKSSSKVGNLERTF